MGACCFMAACVAMYNAWRTSLRPPQIRWRPRYLALPRARGGAQRPQAWNLSTIDLADLSAQRERAVAHRSCTGHARQQVVFQMPDIGATQALGRVFIDCVVARSSQARCLDEPLRIALVVAVCWRYNC